MMEFNRGQLKRSVKLSMKGARPSPMLVTLLFSAIVSAGTWLINTVLGRLLTGGAGSISDTVWLYMQRGYEAQEALYIAMLELFRRGPGAFFGVMAGGLVLSILVSLWQSTMGVGYEDYCLAMVRDENPPMGRIFNALPRFAQVLVTRILTGIFETLWSLLVLAGFCVVLFAAAALDIPVISALLILIDVALMVLGVAWVTMRYALVDYALLDKGLSGMEAIQESKRLMQGNIGRGFVLHLSFFGWYLLESALVILPAAVIGVPVLLSNSLEALVGGIAAIALLMVAGGIAAYVVGLWLQPYINGCWAGFYDWAKGAADGFGGGPRFGGGDRGWSGPSDYTWSSGPDARGTGMGPGSGGPSAHNPPKPRDDPWN